jgi:long-subunit acyl-CoA synthetase (AMP-forming)
MPQARLILDYVYEHERARADQVFLSQPLGGGQVVDYTWRSMMDQARRMAAHLRAQGFAPGARIAILSKNCAHFFMAELAIWMAGYTTVALYPTEAAETVRFVLEHSESSLLFVGKLDEWPRQAAAVPSGLPCIALPLAPSTHFPGWDSIAAATVPMEGTPARAATDLAMILYTSGSTGQPKGVMQSFERISAATAAIVACLTAQLGGDFALRSLSYLPLAHVFERAWVECAQFQLGRGHIFFADRLDTFLQDLQRARPTTFISVPRLWLKFQQGVFSKMPAAKLDRMLRVPILGKFVARKVLAGLGLEAVRLAGSGSAPIPPALIDWYRRLGLNLSEGYAMTEDFACSHTSTAAHRALGHVGIALPGVQVRIAGDGEILIKSPGQLVGYYKRPDLDAEALTADGFFRTGDLGELRADGLLKITGRKKELFKTAKGKYVAPAPIESRLAEDPLIELALVSGAGQANAYALVVLAEELRAKLHDPAVRGEIETRLGALLDQVNAGLVEYERLAMIVVARESWSVENGLLTPTLKIKRARIEAAVAPGVDSWYAQKRRVLWA